MKRISLLLFFALSLLHAAAVEPYNTPRIFWNHNNAIYTGMYGEYARVIELQDGRLMLCVGNTVSFSSDAGETWSKSQVIVPNPTGFRYSSPDCIQLSDGTIVVGEKKNPIEPYTADRLHGIRVVRSLDNGQTWEDPVYVYDAGYEFENGCWEPAFLELPSGELQCYFSDESDFTESDEQSISMCRSFDKGKTWSERTRVSFRAGYRDGMPTVILTDAGEIVMTIEDAGWKGYTGFRATSIRCSLEDNWSETILADSPNREIIFEYEKDYKNYRSAGPYLRKHPDGYTIVSWMGDHFDREAGVFDTYDLFVAVGDKDARKFKAVSAPFDQPLNQGSQWHSVSVLKDGTIIAVGNGNDDNELTLMKGYLKSEFEADFGTPILDGTSLTENYTKHRAQQITLGSKYKNRVNADLLYDNEYLYFTTQTIDKDIVADGEYDNDGYELFFDFENHCTENTYGQSGMFQFYFGLDGKVEMKVGGNNRWTTISDISAIKYLINIKKTYYETEVAIPWSLLGYDAPPVDNTIRMDFRVKDFTGEKMVDIAIADTERRKSYSWMELKLNPNPSGGINDIETNSEDNDVLTIVDDNTIHISCSSANIESVTLFSINGATISQHKSCGTSISLTPSFAGIYIISISLEDGRRFNKKITLK